MNRQIYRKRICYVANIYNMLVFFDKNLTNNNSSKGQRKSVKVTRQEKEWFDVAKIKTNGDDNDHEMMIVWSAERDQMQSIK